MTGVPEVQRDWHIHAQECKGYNRCAGHQRHGPDPYDYREVVQEN
jgi:hypothetical protein